MASLIPNLKTAETKAAVALRTFFTEAPRWMIITVSVFTPGVLALEIAQNWPELIPGAHVLSVFVRNVAYALIASSVFTWIAIELPRRKSAQRTYNTYETHFRTLIGLGPMALAPYRYQVDGTPVVFDSWRADSLTAAAKTIRSRDQNFFGHKRLGLMEHYILAATKTQQTLAPLAPFMHEDIAQAVLSFPNDWSLDALQTQIEPDGSINETRDAYLVMRLLGGSRELYAAITQHAPELSDVSMEVELKDGTTIRVENPELYK